MQSSLWVDMSEIEYSDLRKKRIKGPFYWCILEGRLHGIGLLLQLLSDEPSFLSNLLRTVCLKWKNQAILKSYSYWHISCWHKTRSKLIIGEWFPRQLISPIKFLEWWVRRMSFYTECSLQKILECLSKKVNIKLFDSL